MAKMKVKDYYGGSNTSTEKAKRQVVEDIARFGSEAKQRTQRAVDTEDALRAADPAQDDPLSNAGVLAEMNQNRGLVTGGFADDARASSLAGDESRTRLREAHKQYLDKLNKAVPFSKRQMKSYKAELEAGAAAAASRGRGGGRGGGGRGRGAGSSSANTQSIPHKLSQLGMPDSDVLRLQSVAEGDPNIAKAVDSLYAAGFEGGTNLRDVNTQLRQYLADQGQGSQQYQDWSNMMGAKWGEAYKDSTGEAQPYIPSFQDTEYNQEQFDYGMDRGTPTDTGISADALGEKVGEGTQGEEFFQNGVLFNGQAYTYDEWDRADNLAESVGNAFSFFR